MMGQRLCQLGIFLSALLCAIPCDRAEAAVARGESSTAELKIGAGYFTYKSKLAKSNDTGIRYDYELGVYGGANHSLGAILRGNRMAATFALNSTKVETNQLNFILRYHLGVFYLGLAAGSGQTKYKGSTSSFDASYQNYGANTGLNFELIKRSALFVDLLVTKGMQIKETQQRTVTFPLRIEADVGVQFDLTKRLLNLVLGFRYLRESISFSGTWAESITMPYAAIQFSVNI